MVDEKVLVSELQSVVQREKAFKLLVSKYLRI